MNALPQNQRSQRAVRIRPAEYTPAVLRIEDGSCTQATLEIYSLTGGLLSLQKPLDRGSRARVLFLTQTGPVLGVAEMLPPLSWTEQPFRFLTMHEEDERKLRAATQPAAEIAVECTPPQIESSAGAAGNTPTLDAEEPWIQKYRTAIYDTPPPAKSFFGKLFAGLTGGSLGLAVIVYAFQHFLR